MRYLYTITYDVNRMIGQCHPAARAECVKQITIRRSTIHVSRLSEREDEVDNFGIIAKQAVLQF